jgi:acyl dehydratase
LVPVVPAPGKRIINMAQEVEWFDVIRVGDRLSIKRRIADVFQRPISIDPQAVWVISELIIKNQHGKVVCVVRNTLLFHRSPEEVAADKAGAEG